MEFIRILNDNPWNIHLTWHASQTTADFLDLRINLTPEGHLCTTLFRKQTAVNSLLHYQSFHPRRQKESIPVGQFLRVRRNCSMEQDFENESKELAKRFRQRGYPEQCIQRAARRAKDTNRQVLLKPRRKREDKRLWFCTPFNNQWSDLQRILHKHWNILTSNREVAKWIPPTPKMVPKRAPNLRDQLCHSHFSRPKRKIGQHLRSRGSSPCGSCSVCQMMTKMEEIKNPVNGRIFKIWNHYNCRTKAVVYVLRCPCGLLYVGETKNEMRVRLQKHLSTIRLAQRDKDLGKILPPVAEHFLRKHNGDPQGLTAGVLEQVTLGIRGGDLKKRLRQKETSWIYRLTSRTPDGLNGEFSFAPFLG